VCDLRIELTCAPEFKCNLCVCVCRISSFFDTFEYQLVGNSPRASKPLVLTEVIVVGANSVRVLLFLPLGHQVTNHIFVRIDSYDVSSNTSAICRIHPRVSSTTFTCRNNHATIATTATLEFFLHNNCNELWRILNSSRVMSMGECLLISHQIWKPAQIYFR